MKELIIHNEVVVLLDDHDYDLVSKHSWYLNAKGYPQRIVAAT